MDQKVTTQAVLGELDARGVKFATLRMRSASLMNRINSLTARTQDHHAGPARTLQPAPRPRGPRGDADQLPRHRPPAHRHRTGPRRPHRIITNDDQIKTRALISQYARRMTTSSASPRSSRHSAPTPYPPPSTSTSTSTSSCASWPRPCSPRSAPGSAPATPPPPPTPSSGASSTPPEPSPTTTTPSPSPSADAPTHPSCAVRPVAQGPPSPGGKTGASASSSASRRGGAIRCMEIGVRNWCWSSFPG